MDIKKSLEVKQAILLFSDLFNKAPEDIMQQLCFFDDDIFKILRKASDAWNTFDDAPMAERGAMLGITITTQGEHNENKNYKKNACRR